MTSPPRPFTVRGIRLEAEDVLSVELTPADGSPVPNWDAGAHVDLALPVGGSRQYSLCGPADDLALQIAVRLQRDGRGGSAWVHDSLRPGDVVQISGPRNHFGLEDAPAYVFIAGGIGITPILPMLRAVESRGVPWVLGYFGRSRAAMPFCESLSAYGDEKVRLFSRDDISGPDASQFLVEALGGVDDATLVYVCGPERLLDSARAVMETAGREDRIRTEYFTPPASSAGTDAGGAFTLRLRESGVELTVEPGRSVLEVLEDAGVEMLSDCREGICGSCEVKVVGGDVDHRDHVLTNAEKQANNCMMTCVSRSLSDIIVVDL